jgi:hypothetical protein
MYHITLPTDRGLMWRALFGVIIEEITNSL